jgi:radical S-adenosyl methionine domain-containing protein 2
MQQRDLKAISVNYHILSNCNMSCEFCFAKFTESKEFLEKNTYLSLENAKELIQELHNYGVSKITFVGGEPLLYPWLSELLSFAKSLSMTTMIVTNGMLLNEKWIEENKSNINWIAISIDSLNENTLFDVGRKTKTTTLSKKQYREICYLIKNKGIKLKINTVVFGKNKDDNMSEFILDVSPERWKVFKVLRIEGQNDNMIDMDVSDDDFLNFKRKHDFSNKHNIDIVFEDNNAMTGSYLMIDPAGRFFDNTNGFYKYSNSILNIGVNQALSEIKFDFDLFKERGGLYSW